MVVPNFQMFMRPLLVYCVDGKEKSIQDAVAALTDKFNLSPEDRARVLPSGTETVVANRVRWARTYLAQAGALVNTRRGHFQIGGRGIALLKEHREKIDIKILRQFPEFVAFQSPKSTDDPKGVQDGAASSDAVSATTPDEMIDNAVAEIQTKLELDLLARIIEKPPSFLEKLVTDLIVKMGYGGTHDYVVQQKGKSGDEGIDGIVNEDALGLDVIYVQAKRYDPNTSIGREIIQAFAGALEGKKAQKGVFVATCSFTSQAKAYVQSVTKRIILIDGKELVRLMTRYGVGVSVKREIKIKRIDLDYFDDDDS